MHYAISCQWVWIFLIKLVAFMWTCAKLKRQLYSLSEFLLIWLKIQWKLLATQTQSFFNQISCFRWKRDFFHTMSFVLEFLNESSVELNRIISIYLFILSIHFKQKHSTCFKLRDKVGVTFFKSHFSWVMSTILKIPYRLKWWCCC